MLITISPLVFEKKIIKNGSWDLKNTFLSRSREVKLNGWISLQIFKQGVHYKDRSKSKGDLRIYMDILGDFKDLNSIDF